MVISTYFDDFYVLLTNSCLLFNLVSCTINKNTCVRIDSFFIIYQPDLIGKMSHFKLSQLFAHKVIKYNAHF